MESRSARINKFMRLTDDLTIDSDAVKKKMVFEVIKEAWKEVGELPEIINHICSRLKISRETFSMCVENPAMISSVENISRYIKPGFLQDYLEYTSGVESPEEFHLWSALAIVSASVRKNVLLNYGMFQDTCNLYVVLVGPPGTTRKTTACDIAIDLLEQATDIKIIKDKVTVESLTHNMSKISTEEISEKGGLSVKKAEAQCLLFSPELTVMLGTEQYLAGFSRFLTDIHDNKKQFTVNTISRGEVVLKNPYMVLLGCTTPVELPNAISNTTGEGGLMSRLNIIYKARTPRCFSIPISPSKRQVMLKESLIVQLREMASLRDILFKFSPDGEAWYSHWYEKVWKVSMESGHPNACFSTRDEVKIRKIAMILAMCEGEYEFLSADVLDRACKILSFSTESVRNLLGTGHGGTPTSEAAQKMLDCIYKGGGTISYSQLLKCMYHKRFLAKDVQDILNILIDSNMIKQFDMGAKRYIRVCSTHEMDKEELL